MVIAMQELFQQDVGIGVRQSGNFIASEGDSHDAA